MILPGSEAGLSFFLNDNVVSGESCGETKEGTQKGERAQQARSEKERHIEL